MGLKRYVAQSVESRWGSSVLSCEVCDWRIDTVTRIGSVIV